MRLVAALGILITAFVTAGASARPQDVSAFLASYDLVEQLAADLGKEK